MPLLCALLLAACTKAPTPAAVPAAAPVPAAEPAPGLIPLETQRVSYVCADGSEILLKLFDDQRARIDVEGVEQVLRPVPTDDGTLFLGEEVNLRITGQQATLSRGGKFLESACTLKKTA
ncbi:MAG: hypothetical protein NVS9B10_21670 [Nevskia sp.]